MTDRRTILRFTRSERVYHWAQALPYLVLMVTGAWMLARSVGGPETNVEDGWVTAHKVAGVAMLLLPFLAGLGGHWPSLWENVRVAVRWNRNDLRWMKAAIVGLVKHDVPVPPMGKFNPGQKLNFLATLVLMPAMAATGLLMWFVKGALLAWLVHVSLFFVAVVLVTGHVYMAALNPSTRHSLRAMFGLAVDVHWARHHHALWVEDSLGQAGSHAGRQPPPRWRVRVRIGVLAVTLLAAIVGSIWLGIRFKDQGRRAVRRPESFLAPGQLTLAHASDDRLKKDCYMCHELTREVSGKKCVRCHSLIATRIAERIGLHSGFRRACIECHTEHRGNDFDIVPFDSETFSHERTAFLLRGAHRRLDCDTCHEQPKAWSERPRRTFIGLAHSQCRHCHTDPHDGHLESDCLSCHTREKWTGRELRFVHNRDARFKLQGAHAAVPCRLCHQPPEGKPLAAAQFKGLKTDCVACHGAPHAGQFRPDRCTRCHGMRGWKGRALLFEHRRDSRFRLEGKHAALPCAKCHKPPAGKPLAAATFRSRGTDCVGCHPDPHAGQFQRNTCTRCHRTTGWKGRHLAFDHDTQAPFKLDATHAAIACVGCHPDRRYKPTPTTCKGCHPDVERMLAGSFPRPDALSVPDPHAGKLKCVDCHDTSVRRQSLTSYASACVKCHNEHYGQLLLAWRSASVERILKATVLLKRRTRHEARGPDRRPATRDRLTRLNHMGAHNPILQARRLDRLIRSLEQAP